MSQYTTDEIRAALESVTSALAVAQNILTDLLKERVAREIIEDGELPGSATLEDVRRILHAGGKLYVPARNDDSLGVRISLSEPSYDIVTWTFSNHEGGEVKGADLLAAWRVLSAAASSGKKIMVNGNGVEEDYD